MNQSNCDLFSSSQSKHGNFLPYFLIFPPQVWQTVCEVYQHADERHDVPARRVDGHAQEDPRGPGGDGGQAEVEPADSG